MKIIDLLNKIANNEIKTGTKIIFSDMEFIYDYPNLCGIYRKGYPAKRENDLYSYLETINLNLPVEIEEQQEIDIQNIKKFEIDKNNYIQTELGAFKTRKMDIAFLNKINDLIIAVKQLDKKINLQSNKKTQ